MCLDRNFMVCHDAGFWGFRSEPRWQPAWDAAATAEPGNPAQGGGTTGGAAPGAGGSPPGGGETSGGVAPTAGSSSGGSSVAGGSSGGRGSGWHRQRRQLRRLARDAGF